MTSDEQRMAEGLRQLQRRADGEAPSFGGTWAAARARRDRRPMLAAVAGAAVVGLIVVSLVGRSPEPAAPGLVDVEELVASTTWVAPSDSLLPDKRFDIFQELPEMFESTGTEEGTLL